VIGGFKYTYRCELDEIEEETGIDKIGDAIRWNTKNIDRDVIIDLVGLWG